MRSVRTQIGGLGNLLFKQAYIIGKCLDGEIPDVYVQDSKYWEKHRDAVKQYFSEGITKNNQVALHIRRGDYLKADHFHIDLTKSDYYSRAIRYFPTDTFLVFCKDNQGKEQDLQDRVWVENYLNTIFENDRWEFAPFENTEVEDLNLMASCKSIIGANSSFSWWAAFLGNHEAAIFPKEWFADRIQRTELIPSWILL